MELREMKKQIIATSLALLVLAGGFAGFASAAPASDHTETFVVTADESDTAEFGSSIALAGTTDDTASTVYLGHGEEETWVESIDMTGLATARYLSVNEGQEGLYYVGQEYSTQKQFVGYAEGESDEQLFSNMAPGESGSQSEVSAKVVGDHYDSDDTTEIVVANPNRVDDYAGAAQYAKVNDVPLLYAETVDDVERIQNLDLGAQTVTVGESVKADVRSELESNYDSYSELNTSDGADFVNNQTQGASTLVLVSSLSDSALAHGVTGPETEVMIVDSADNLGEDVETYLETHDPNNVVVASQESDITPSTADDARDLTSGSVERVAGNSDTTLVNRLALWDSGMEDPLPAVENVDYEETDGGLTVTADVTNIGFAKAVETELELQRGGANFEFIEEDPQIEESEDGYVVWEMVDLVDGETRTIQYQVSDVGENTGDAPQVSSYSDGTGSTYAGTMSAMEVPNEILDRISGISGYIGGLVAGLSGTTIAILGAGGLLFAGGVVYIARREDAI